MAALTIQFLVKEGENIVAQATNVLTNDLHLQDFMEKTLPGLEETFKQILAKDVPVIESTVETVINDLEKGI